MLWARGQTTTASQICDAVKFGAGEEIRTPDPLVGNEMLYH